MGVDASPNGSSANRHVLSDPCVSPTQLASQRFAPVKCKPGENLPNAYRSSVHQVSATDLYNFVPSLPT